MTARDWLDLLQQIPFHETEARRLIDKRLMSAQCQELIELLSSDKVVSLAGLTTTRP